MQGYENANFRACPSNVVYLLKTLRVNKTDVVTMSFEYEYTIQLFQVTSSDDE